MKRANFVTNLLGNDDKKSTHRVKSCFLPYYEHVLYIQGIDYAERFLEKCFPTCKVVGAQFLFCTCDLIWRRTVTFGRCLGFFSGQAKRRQRYSSWNVLCFVLSFNLTHNFCY